MATHGAHAHRLKLGDMLIAEGLIDEIQMRSALGYQKKWGCRFGSALVELGLIKEEDVARMLEKQLREPCLTGIMLNPEPDALKLMSAEAATRHMMLPLRVEGNELIMATTNPSDLSLADELGYKLGKRIKGVLAVESAIKKSIKKHYGGGFKDPERMVDVEPVAGKSALEIIYHEKDTDRSAPPKSKPKPKPRKVEPTAELISKAVAFLLIEKGIIRREELVERMKAIKEKEEG